MSETIVEFAAHEGVATITLNRPDSLNAMNSDLMTGISESMSRVEEDKTVRVVVITGAGRGFCAGADLSRTVGTEEPGNQAMGDVFNPALRAAAGGGMGLALACDIVIAAKSAFFVATFGPRLGIVPDLGSTWTMPRSLGRARALAAAMLGDRIPSKTAELWGLIWKSVPDDKLDSEIDEVTARLKVTSADAMVRIRQSIDAASTNTFSEQLDLEMHHQGILIPKNMQEGAAAFIEKREPLFPPRS